MKGRHVLVAAAAAIAIGSFLPWVNATAPFVGSVSKSGISLSDGLTDGWFFVGLGGLLALATLNPAAGRLTGVGLVLAGCVGLWILDFNELSGRVSAVKDAVRGNMFASSVSADVGLGFWLIGAGLVTGIIGAFMMRNEQHVAELVEATVETVETQ